MFCNFNWNWLYFNTHKVSSTSLFLPEIMHPYSMDGTNQIKNDQSLLATRVVIITNYSRQHAVESLVNGNLRIILSAKSFNRIPIQVVRVKFGKCETKMETFNQIVCVCVCLGYEYCVIAPLDNAVCCVCGRWSWLSVMATGLTSVTPKHPGMCVSVTCHDWTETLATGCTYFMRSYVTSIHALHARHGIERVIIIRDPHIIGKTFYIQRVKFTLFVYIRLFSMHL